MDEPGPFSFSPSSLSFLWLPQEQVELFKGRTPRLSYLPTADGLSVNDCLSRELLTRPTQPSSVLYSVVLVDEMGESKALSSGGEGMKRREVINTSKKSGKFLCE